MHRLKVSLLCLMSLMTLGVTGFGQDSGYATYDAYSYSGGVTDGTYFNLRHMSGRGVGYEGGYNQIGGMMPFWLSDNVMIGPDVRLMITNNSEVGGNIGGLSRYYSDRFDRTFGVGAWFDMDQSSNDNTYTQGTIGFETLGQWWDLRGNAYYVPGDQDHLVSNGAPLCVSGDPFFSGNNIVFLGQQAALREQAMDGFDLEFGMPISQALPWIRLYAGTYYYRANQATPAMVDVPIPNETEDKPWGFRGRADFWVSDDLLLGVNVTTDDVWGTNVNGVVDFRFSGFKPTRYFPNFSTRERMLAPWQRNWRVAVEQYGTARETLITAINPDTGRPYFVSFINNENPNPGDGTFENPFNTWNHPNGIPGADIILVDRGTSTEANPYLGTMKLFDNQLLLGEGSSIDPIRLQAIFGNCSVDGDFTLPGLDGSGNYPFVSNPAAFQAITLANNNEVAGFNIVRGGGDGIKGVGINNFNLHNIEITGNAGRGINLIGATGTTTIIRDINVGTPNHPNPNGIGNSAGGGLFVSAGAAGISNLQITNARFNSNPPFAPGGLQPFGISLNATDGSLATTMTNVHANGNVNGIVLTEDNQTLSATMVNVQANNNASRGIQLIANGGTATLDMTNTQVNNNGLDGLSLFGAAGSTTTVNITDSQLNFNTRDGIHQTLVGASTANVNIDPTLVSQNGRDGYNFTVTEGSTLNFTSNGDFYNSNARSAFFGLVDSSIVNMSLTNVTATNSGDNGFTLTANNGSTVTTNMTGGSLSNSGGSGISASLNTGSTVSFSMIGTTINSNVQNGVTFMADDSAFSLTAMNSTFNGNLTNGILGTLLNTATANVTTNVGTQINSNSQDGVRIAASGLSNVTAVFQDTSINANLTGDGIQLDLNDSPNSRLALLGTSTVNNNGANGVLVNATNGTVFTPTLIGTTIQGNGEDGVQLNASNSTVGGTGGNAGNFTNVTIQGNTFDGLDVNVGGLNAFSNLNIVNSTITANGLAGIRATATGDAPGLGQLGASLNICLDNTDVTLNTEQGILITSTGAGAVASFGVGDLSPGSASNVSNNGLEGVLANAIAEGTINFRSIGSTFNNNGTAATSAGLNFGGDNGVIRTLFHGGSADNNSGDGLRFGPILPNVSTNGSDFTISLANGFSASNNGGFGLNVDATGANSANLLQDPNTPAPVFVGNGAGAQNLNFVGVNQVVLQHVGSFNGNAGDGVTANFANIGTAIISFNGLGTGTINNNGGHGINVTMTNVQNGSVLVTGYTDISNNALDGIHIEMDGSGLVNPMNVAIEIDGVAGLTNMDGNTNAVNIITTDVHFVNDFASLPGVNLTVLTTTDNQAFNACIPLPVSAAGGLAGLTPDLGLDIHNLNVTNSTAAGIVVAGTDTTFEADSATISNNTVADSLGGPGISVLINETVAPTVDIVDGFNFNGNTVSGNAGNGIEFGITNAVAIAVVTADDVHFNGNTISGNAGDGINVALINVTGSTSTADGMQFNANTISGNTGNGVAIDLTAVTATAMTANNSTISGNLANGIDLVLNGTGTFPETEAFLTISGSTISDNQVNGVETSADAASRLNLILTNSTLIDSNFADGVLMNATGTDTRANITMVNSTISNNGVSVAGNGITANYDDNADGTITLTNAIIENTAAPGTQVNGLLVNVNQTTVGADTNAIVNIHNSQLLNNSASGLAGNITGVNGGPNPVNGATVLIDQGTLVSGNEGNGVAFLVNDAALLRLSVHDSSITGNGQNGLFIDAQVLDTLVAVDLHDSSLSNNGTALFPGDGFNATVSTGATLNVCAETTGLGAIPMNFSGNTGDGIDVIVSDADSRADIDLHAIIAGVDAVNGLASNTLNGVSTQVFDGGELNLRANVSHFDGNGGAGLFGSVTASNGVDTVGRYRIIGGTADSNSGDGFSFIATNTLGAPNGVATLTAQFEADDFGTGISAQNNGGFGLQFLTNTPGGGVVGNLLMTGGSTLIGNSAGTLNVDMQGADQAIIGLSGTFNGSTTGDGIHIELANITGLALVSIQGPGEVRNNAGDGIDISMTNVAQGGVFIGGFSDVSDNGTGNDASIGQDGIKVTMNNVTLGAVAINGETATVPGNIMNVSNNTGNGVNVIVNNGSVIDNAAFAGGLVNVDIIDYTPPDVPCPDPLPNPLLTIVSVDVTTALGIDFGTGLAIQNLNIDNNGNATAGDTSGDGIVLNVDNAEIVGIPSINNNTISNTGSTSATTTHSGINIILTNGANVSGLDVVENDINNNNGDGFTMIQPNFAPAVFTLNFERGSLASNTGNGVFVDLPSPSLLTTDMDINFTNVDVSSNTGDGIHIELATVLNSSANADVTILSDNGTANQITGNLFNTISNNGGMGVFITNSDNLQANVSTMSLVIGGTGGINEFDSNNDAGVGINLAGSADGTATVSNASFTNTGFANTHGAAFQGDGFAVFINGTTSVVDEATFNNATLGDAALQNTSFTGNAGSGIRVSTSLNGSSDALTVQNSEIDSNTGNGLTFLRNAGILTPGPYITNVTINQNNITNNDVGIDISSQFADGADDYTITNNTIETNRSHGIEFFTQADADVFATIDTNQINNNGGEGIFGTQNLGNTDVGVITADITNNTITFNTLCGIDITALHQLDIGGAGALQSNTISDNGVDGIRITGSSVAQFGIGPGAIAVAATDTIIENQINNNAANGITINSVGLETVIIQDNNVLAVTPGGNLGGINNNGNDGIQLNAVAGLIGATIDGNDVLSSGADGVQLLVNDTGTGGFITNNVAITGNIIDDSQARGINILNAADARTNVQIDGNEVTRSVREGVYIVNTSTTGTLGNGSATVQGIDALASATMAEANTWLNDPRLALTMGNNLITSNGQSANGGNFIGTSGLVLRVGSSDASNSFTDPGGFASSYTSAALTDATVMSTALMTRGGVAANIHNNTFGGNFASDVTFQAYRSTTAPPTTGGAWNDNNDNPRNNANDVFNVTSYTSDPLARLDLRFTATNTGDGIIATRGDTFSGTNGAFYNNDEPIFKSRTTGQDGNDPPGGVNDDGGPFQTGTRRRIITRQASNDPPFDRPNNVGSVVDTGTNGFLYPGVSLNNTFRISGDTSDGGFAVANGGFGAIVISGAQVGEENFEWGALP